MKTAVKLRPTAYAWMLAAGMLAATHTSRSLAADAQTTDAAEAAPAKAKAIDSAPLPKKAKRQAPYGIESQNQCVVFILARSESPGVAGDVFHFRDLLKQTVAKGRALSRTESSKSGFDRIEVALARLKDKPCPILKEARPALGDAEVKGNPELMSLPSRFELAAQGGYILENWKVSEKASGTGVAAGLLLSYEFSRSGSFGMLLHGTSSYELLTFKNQAQGLVGVDPTSSVTRVLTGGGAGIAYHLGNNGHSRLQLLGLFEISVMGDIDFKIGDKSSKRDYAVSRRIRPSLRFDQKLFSVLLIGVGASYSLLEMNIPDSTGAKVKVSGDAVQAEVGLGVSF